MTNHPTPDSIPISSLNALEYCPRRFYYQFVQGEMLINEFVLEGTLVHQRAHQAGTQTTAGGDIQTTHLYLYSEALHLAGFADVVEEQGGLLIPVEYKHGQQGYQAARQAWYARNQTRPAATLSPAGSSDRAGLR